MRKHYNRFAMKTLLSVAFILLLCSCDQMDCCDPPPDEWGDDNYFTFSVKNEKGEDLLNPQTKGAYNHTIISLFRFVEDKYVRVYNPMKYPSKGYEIANIDGVYIFYPHFNVHDPSLFPEGYPFSYYRKGLIVWNESETDTLEMELVDQPVRENRRLNRIWHNGELVWDWDTAIRSDKNHAWYFEIIK